MGGLGVDVVDAIDAARLKMCIISGREFKAARRQPQPRNRATARHNHTTTQPYYLNHTTAQPQQATVIIIAWDIFSGQLNRDLIPPDK